MAPAAYPVSAYRGQVSPRSRAVAAILSLAVVAALIVALILTGMLPLPVPREIRSLATFTVLPPATREASEASPAKRPATPVRTPPPPPPPTRTVPPEPPIVPMPPEMIVLTRQQFAGGDIGKIAPLPGAAAGTTSANAGSGAGDSEGVGTGPGGQRLYNAEWYRKPTRAEMVTYLPARQQVGWGMIVCKTIPDNRVEDCRELGESPGSGIARAMRQAAWQFLIRPPRKGGKPMIGALVRIRYDLIEGPAG